MTRWWAVAALVLASTAAGVVALVAFVMWERRTPAPLVDLSLFRSARFNSGTILGTVINFTMLGVLFTMPQYYQAIPGTDAMGSGFRLLPMVGGLLGDRATRTVRARHGAGHEQVGRGTAQRRPRPEEARRRRRPHTRDRSRSAVSGSACRRAEDRALGAVVPAAYPLPARGCDAGGPGRTVGVCR